MFNILTPLRLVERVSRKINSSTFVAVPGIWAEVTSTGALVNVSANQALVNKLVIGDASSSIYESHDVSVGRITTMESHGIRVQTDSVGFLYSNLANVNIGDECYVAVGTGKLASVNENPEAMVVSDGSFEIVARIEQVDATAGWVIYRTTSPVMSTIEGSSESPSESASESPSESASVSPSASESPSASSSESPSESASESPSS